MLKRVRIALTALLLLAAVGVNAQVTTASMAGKVTDASNEPLSAPLYRLFISLPVRATEP